MKKLITFLMLGVFAMVLFSCKDDDPVYQQEYPTVLDIRENFVNSTAANTTNFLYGINKTFTSAIPSSDVVLIYRQDTSSGTAVWKLLPKSYFFTEGQLDYHFDFTTADVQIYADADFNMTNMDSSFKNAYLNNQVFRVVIIPATFGKNSGVNYEDYNSVINYYKIDDSKATKL